ncbi:mitochondrial S-adenosylmethionine carrier protein isoform X3 [Anser cygnoides]|uniref:mitochondrial S-adenosylmethionine carrier protein isoform X3 n=1 Tax=Anser cygnoides TaxID=8845 RepID=UPI0034D205BE
MEPRESWAALAAGGVAGVCVDLILFPLDTVKTRLQSPQGFWKAGGFRGIYAGVPSTAIGSFPNAAAFFITYENVKSVLPHGSASYLTPVTHMVAASSGEVVACLIRVPSEVVKQRAQVSPSASTFRILSHTLYHEGIQGLYRGYKSTVLREEKRIALCPRLTVGASGKGRNSSSWSSKEHRPSEVSEPQSQEPGRAFFALLSRNQSVSMRWSSTSHCLTLQPLF